MRLEPQKRQDLLDRYAAGPAKVLEVYAALDEAALDRRPAPMEWSAREIAHHLADAETRAYLRARQIYAEESPVVQSYDEFLWARKLHYERPIEVSLRVVAAVRASTAELLGLLPVDDDLLWSRGGLHEESGAYTLDNWLSVYAKHCDEHAEQARRAAAEVAGEA